jgi:nucleotide-binding universal stress UspA family protein
LLAVDGSERGLQTVRHAARFEPYQRIQVNLFHVFSAVPDSYWDLEKEPKSVKSVKHVRAWEHQQRKEIQQYMQKAERILLNAGFHAENVRVTVQDRKKGVARDIIREAQNDYDLVITRRRGLGGMRGIPMGSVAVKLMAKLSFVPVVISGRKPPKSKILIAIDGSQGSWRAVDFVGDLLVGYDLKIKLFHVIRSKKSKISQLRPLFTPVGFTREREKEIDDVFIRAKQRLVRAGFEPNRIKTRTIIGARSRAEAIAEEAKLNTYRVIVMGRRGLSRADDFSMGRVTSKVIQLAKESAVWIVP